MKHFLDNDNNNSNIHSQAEVDEVDYISSGAESSPIISAIVETPYRFS